MELFIYENLLASLIAIGIIGLCYKRVTRYYLDEEHPVFYSVPVPEQCNASWEGKVLDKPSIKVHGYSSIQCYCPCDGKLLGTVNPVSADGIDRSVAKAEEAQFEWSKTTFSQRRKVLKTLLRFILDNRDTITAVACFDSGKTRVDAFFGEVLVTAEKLKWTIDHGEKALAPEKRPTNFLMMYKSNEVVWEPLGVVAACVSWNYPFHNLIGPVIAAIFAGNAIVVKVSENTAWSSIYFTSIVKGAFTACGHSPSLVQTVFCWPSVADHLTSHPKISHITFIGSRTVAHAVCSSAAKALTPVCVELGGKDPAIILDDVGSDLPRVIDILMRGVFQAAGQNCIGIERIIALPGIYDILIQELTPRIEALRVGNDLGLDQNTTTAKQQPIDVGACISDINFTNLETLISEAVSQGANLITGGTRFHHPSYPSGHYFTPTLITNVLPSMRIAQTELFAPICLIMRCSSSIPQAIALANSTSYALGASVFGYNTAHLNDVVTGIKAGMVAVNDFAAYYAVQLPFGGVKGSGYGRFAGVEGLRGLCNTKAVCRDRWPGLMRTSIPPELVYPVGGRGGKEDDGNGRKRADGVCRGILDLGYGMGVRERVGGLLKIVGL